MRKMKGRKDGLAKGILVREKNLNKKIKNNEYKEEYRRGKDKVVEEIKENKPI
jgi:hypothetical protein